MNRNNCDVIILRGEKYRVFLKNIDELLLIRLQGKVCRVILINKRQEKSLITPTKLGRGDVASHFKINVGRHHSQNTH